MNRVEEKNHDWYEASLSELCRVVGGGTPSRANPLYWKGEIPWASVKDFNDDSVYLRTTEERISNDGLLSSSSRLVPENTPLVCTRMAVGRCALTVHPTAINQDVKALIPNDSIVPEFLVRLLYFHADNLMRIAIGSTVKGISTGQLLALRVCYPEIDEQQRIASVLNTLDTVIEKSESLIAKLKQVRTGMLHDLLTCGVDENGKIRDPLLNLEQFQDSPFGSVPSTWSIETLGVRLLRCKGRIQTGPFGSQLHASEYTIQGIPVVMPQDIDGGNISEANIARISNKRAAELFRHKFQCNDLVFARRGDLGRCAVINQLETGWLCGTGCLLMRFEPKDLLPEWLSLAYRHDIGQRQIAARAVGTTMVNLNTGILNHLIFPFPPMDEQHVIVDMLDGIDSSIAEENDNLKKALTLKIGLSADLLTGQTRIPPNLELP